MSASEKHSSSSTVAVREVDPLLKDLSEKKQNFRRSVVSLASELNEVRSRLAVQEHCVARETHARQEAENKAKVMEDEIIRLQRNLGEKNDELQASTSAAEMYVREMVDLRLQFATTKEIAEASSLSAQSAHLLCATLVKELEEKTFSLKEQESRVHKLEEQLVFLLKDLRAREFSQIQLKDEVSRIEHEVMQSLTIVGSNTDCDLRKLLEETSPRTFDRINNLLVAKDDEIINLRDDIRIVSAHWKLKTDEMEYQLENHRKADQDLRKKVVKLEFYLKEARSQTRKLQRMGEERDKALKELRDQLAAKQASEPSSSKKQIFWESAGFKIAVSMSMLVLVIVSKR